MFGKTHFGRITALWTLFLLGGMSSVFGAGFKQLHGHVPVAAKNLTAIGRVPATNELHLAIGVPLRDPAGLDKFLADVYNPASPNYRHFLVPTEFTARFSATEADYAAVKQFARTNGFKISGEHGNRLLLSVTAKAADIERAFHFKLKKFKHPTTAREFFAPDVEPTVDAALAVVDVSGLSDYYQLHPKLQKMDIKTVAPKNGSAPDGYSYIGDDFRNAYAPGVTLTGAGQSVGLVQFDGFYSNDISAYAVAAGGGRTNIVIQTVLLDNYGGGITSANGNGEVSLDIEMAMAMAPGLAKIVVFEAPNNTAYFNDVLNAMAASNQIKNLSCSWGGGGPNASSETIFKTMAAQGQSFFNASGDSDAFTGSVPFPSESPNITQVGGTTLTMNSGGGAYTSETVWNWGWDQNANGGAGGYVGSSGGTSTTYAIPSWQLGISMTSNGGSTTMRNIPDVALTADNCYVKYGNGTSGAFGGTSCAAPLWAGFMALVNQQAATTGHASIGFANPSLYTIGKSASYTNCFHDTTTGDNSWLNSAGNYSAVTGYDLCTGWGTPNGQNLIDTLVELADKLGILPWTGFNSIGIFGGPFSPNQQNFTLTNSGTNSFSWQVINLPVWLTAQPSDGTLLAGEHTNVSLDLNLVASNLFIGVYQTNFWITNLTTYVGQIIPASLQIIDSLALSTTNSFTAYGVVGGPFSPGSQTFVFTNLSASPVGWSLINTSSWLSASGSSGTLSPIEETNVTISLNSTANSLAMGNYYATIGLSNQTSHFLHNCQIALQITDSLVLMTTNGFTAYGAVGGPFSPGSQAVVFTNLSASPVAWSIINTSSWLSVSSDKGSIVGNSSVSVTVATNATTASLAVGTYSTTLVLSNQSSCFTESLVFSAAVGQNIVQNGGFEMGDFTGWNLNGDGYDVNYVDSSPQHPPHSGAYCALLGEMYSLAYLSQTLATVAGQQYLLSFWLANDYRGTPDIFQASWNGTNIYTINNPMGMDWTNLNFIVTATSPTTTLDFAAENDPGYFGLDDVSVTPIPTPSFTGYSQTANGFVFTWNSLPSLTYLVQYKTNLLQANWMDLATNIATANTFSYTNLSGADPSRFYRVQLLP